MFAGAKQKLERANYHIADLERQFQHFVAEKPHRFNVQSDPQTGGLVLSIRFLKEVPSTLPLVIGDAIHNLRSALDHMVWELVGHDHGTQDRYLKFPTGDNRVSFEASCKGIKTPSQWVKDMLIATEAFAGGNGDDLYNLNQLDNVDKHTVIIPVLRATSHPPFRVLNPNGSLFIRMEGNVLVGGLGDSFKIGNFGLGKSIELDDNVDCPPSIFFGQAGAAGRIPAISLLRQFSLSANRTI